MDQVRVLRIIEYTGPRDAVEEQVRRSLHGTRYGLRLDNGHCVITAATLSQYPEILEIARLKVAKSEDIQPPLGETD